jgi:hypothetical protein
MARFRWLTIALAVVVASFAFVACGGDDDDDDDGGDSTPVAGQTVDDGDDGDDDDGDDGDDGSDADARELFNRFTDASFVVVYDLTSLDPAGGDLTGSMAWYQDGERSRFDFSGESEGESFNLISISTPDVQATCFDDASGFGEALGTGGEGGVCLTSSPLGDLGFQSVRGDLQELLDDGAEIRRVDSRRIAGQDADCYEVTDEGIPGTACIDDDGRLLLAESEGVTLEATEVRGAPSDSDFELPYPVQEIPGLPGQ